MSDNLDATAARLQQQVHSAELQIDDALIAASTLMASVVTARRDTDGVPATKGQATIQRIAKAQMALIDASGDVLRVHGDLIEIGRETAGYDLHPQCPKRSTGRLLQAVA